MTQFASESFGICRFRGSCTRECHLSSLINPRVLKIERGLHVKMLRWTLPLLRFDRERMQCVYEVILLYKISRNHLLSENMQWYYRSFNVTLNYLTRSLTRSLNLRDIFFGARQLRATMLSDSWQWAKPFTPCAARTIIFQRENLTYLIVCFTQCTLFFQKVCFLLPCVICMYVTKINAVLWHRVRQTFASLGSFTFARIACLLQLWIKTSELDCSIWATPN